MTYEGAMTREAEDKRNGKIARRRVLNVAAAGAGLAVGSGLVRGFPTIWAQNAKDVTLVHAGGSYAAIMEIGDQASKDLGFKIVMQAITDDVQLNRSLTQPNSIDINNIDSVKLPYLVGKGVLAPVPVPKYKYWADTVPLFTKNAYPNGSRPRTKACRRPRRCSMRPLGTQVGHRARSEKCQRRT
jgi:putative spermidine/putrescine transport system substrate-binding protein